LFNCLAWSETKSSCVVDEGVNNLNWCSYISKFHVPRVMT